MPDLDAQIRAWVDGRNEGAAPVALDEIRTRATTIDLAPDPTPRRNTRPLAIAAAILLLAMVAGASFLLLTDDDTQDVTTDPSDSLLPRLAALAPADEPNATVEVLDLETLRAATGIVRPGPDSSLAVSQEYLASLDQEGALPARAFGPMPIDDGQVEAWRNEFGVDLAQIHGSLTVMSPPDEIIVLVGEIDSSAVDTAVHTISDEWDDALRVETHRGVQFYSWWDDHHMEPSRRTATDPRGTSRRVSVVDDLLIVTRSTSSMTSTIDAVQDGHRSPLADLAEVLVDRDGTAVLSAWPSAALTTGTFISTDRPFTPTDGEPRSHVIAILEPGGHNLEGEVEQTVDDTASRGGWTDEMRFAVSLERVNDQVLMVNVDPVPGDEQQQHAAMTESLWAGLLSAPVADR